MFNILITAFQMRKPRHRKVNDLPKVTYLMSGRAPFNLNMLVKSSSSLCKCLDNRIIFYLASISLQSSASGIQDRTEAVALGQNKAMSGWTDHSGLEAIPER